MTFGLTQSATTTSGNFTLNPLNAQSVPSLQQVIFTPFTTVWVWLESQISSGVVLTSVFSKVAVVTFGGSVTTQPLAYDAHHGQFEPPAGSAANVRFLDFTIRRQSHQEVALKRIACEEKPCRCGGYYLAAKTKPD